MYIPFSKLYDLYKLNITGILHVGAYECEEIIYYEKYVPRNKILWIEAMYDKVMNNKIKYKDLMIEHAIVSDCEEIVKFNISNNGQSSSFLELGEHKLIYPDVEYINYFYDKTKTLNNILKNYNDIKFNFLNLDIQGTELKAIKGMENYLKFVDYIYTEVNICEIYIGCTILNDLDEYLNKHGFKRVELEWGYNNKWGDAFYIRKNHLN